MTNSDLNAQIALYFGFKQSEGEEFLVDGLPQWTYPDEWYLSQGGGTRFRLFELVEVKHYANIHTIIGASHC